MGIVIDDSVIIHGICAGKVVGVSGNKIQVYHGNTAEWVNITDARKVTPEEARAFKRRKFMNAGFRNNQKL